MPATALIPYEINEAKSLARTVNRAGTLAHAHKASFPAQAAGHLWKAQRALFKRVQMLKEPVDMIVGKGDDQVVVKMHDDKALCECIKTLCQVIEHRRIVLRIPGPGRDVEKAKNDTPDMRPADIVEIASANEPSIPSDASQSAHPPKS